MKQFTSHISQLSAVLILGHGSPVKKANDTLHKVADCVCKKGGYEIVQPAFLQFEHPNFSEAIDILVNKGFKQIIVQPYFLYMGAHVTKDLPFEIETAKKKYPNLEIILAPHLGFHKKLVDVAVERIEEVKEQWSRGQGRVPIRRMGGGSKEIASASPRNDILLNPRTLESSNPVFQHPIETESFRLIGEQLDESKFSPLELPIIKRIIHTTADFEYADLVRFSSNAIEAGIDAISKGADIITDVKMAAVGISKERLNKFGGNVWCFVSDADVIQKAKKDNITRTAASMQKALEFMNDSIVAIGNAPTALLEIIKMIKTQNIKPALVIGASVGFVDAEESKEELMKLDVPYISIKGKKGGSTVAVAIVNALLMLAEGRLCQQ
ncbi:MAG: precorrin-8X methylmutase [Deltaproteobacteria bacterium]|nr:precorrin-8X methylmutase [Deltaproteobacteria bacterium]